MADAGVVDPCANEVPDQHRAVSPCGIGEHDLPQVDAPKDDEVMIAEEPDRHDDRRTFHQIPQSQISQAQALQVPLFRHALQIE
ncbi:MAG TPA: hypothetical protein VGN43_13380 [Steroidobacteraceae bacterium]|jgi:hypothetical protein|nr:hypothetical protein [Steroidobacteraceae bacterium]